MDGRARMILLILLLLVTLLDVQQRTQVAAAQRPLRLVPPAPALVPSFGRAAIGSAQASTATPPPTPTPDAEGRIIYEVRSGDTPLGIAERFGIDLQTLYTYNDLDGESFLRIGQRLIVGFTENVLTLTPPPPSGVPEGAILRDDNAYIYEIEAGDTLSLVAFRYDLSLAELLALNEGLTRDALLQVGQELIVGWRQEPRSVGGSADLPLPTQAASPSPPPTSSATPAAILVPPPTALAAEEAAATAPGTASEPGAATPEPVVLENESASSAPLHPERTAVTVLLLGGVLLLGLAGLALFLFVRRS